MEVLEKIFSGVLQASLTASVAGIAVITLLKIFDKYISIRVKNILLILVLIKFLIPVIPETNIIMFNTWYQKYQNTLQSQEVSNNLQQVTRLKTMDQEKSEDKNYNQHSEIKLENEIQDIKKQNLILYILKIVSCIWILGALILILALLLFMINFKRKTKHLENNTYSDVLALIEDCKHKANISSSIPVYVCDIFKSPFILGIIKPRIYIPEFILRTNDNKQLSHIFLHELMHYKRKDLLYNFLGIIVLLMHWFNPIAWIIIKQMKIYREYACDTCVLELLGEKETIEYGMTLINLSKMFVNKNEYSGLAIYFETKKQIKGRIKMIKQFKKGSYKMSIMGILGCAAAAAIIIVSSINVKALDFNNNTVTIKSDAVNAKDASKFLIDTPVKTYDNIEKVEKVAGFKFKLPDFPQANKADSLQFIKLSDEDNVLLVYLGGDIKLTFEVSDKDPLEYLKTIESTKNKSRNLEVKSEEESMKLGEIDGYNVTVTATSPTQTLENGDVIPELQFGYKYYSWKDEGLWYSIEYNSTLRSSGKNEKQIYNISQDNIEKIAKSIVYPAEIKNVDYSVEQEAPSTEVVTMEIYDKEDLDKAKNLLGFNPKLPLEINEDIKIEQSDIGISEDSDIKNNQINYELNSFYSNKLGSITFTEKKSSKEYESISKKGYADIGENKQVKVEKLNINNNEVFKYIYSDEYAKDNSENMGEYIWKEDNIYYSVFFNGNIDNSDEIATNFMNSKTIE